jgi:Zn-dependent peptidase ImmA (M78 family)
MTALTRADAEREADRIRASIWGDAFPVDPVKIARRLGVDVVEADLGQNVAGALVKDIGQDPTILLSVVDSPNRKRFTCAHELGHFVARAEDPEEYDYVDLRDALSKTGTKPEEIFANSFAAALLMPETEVQRLEDKGLSAMQLALYFGVSQEAMHYRLKNLRQPA